MLKTTCLSEWGSQHQADTHGVEHKLVSERNQYFNPIWDISDVLTPCVAQGVSEYKTGLFLRITFYHL